MIRGSIASRLALAPLALAALAWAGGAWAQLDTHSSAPADTTANQMEVINSKCLAILTGQAEVLQGTTRLRADTISVYTKPKGVDASGQRACGAAERIVADGNVYYVTPEQNVRGDHAVYTDASDEIVVTGDVIVVQGQSVARGSKLTIKVSTKQATMVSNATGLGKPGRVRGVFYQTKSDQAGAAKPAPATPETGKP
jgi:lipopolysaccharide export system protein LptA